MLRLLNCEGAGRVILAGLKRAVSIATVVAFYFTRPLRTYIYRASENFAYINKVVRRVCIFRRAAIPRRPLKAIKTAIDKYFELSIIYKSFESRRATCLFFIYYIATKFFMQAQNSSLSASFLEEKKIKSKSVQQYLTEHLTISEPENTLLVEFYTDKKSPSKYFEAPNLRSVSSGRWGLTP